MHKFGILKSGRQEPKLKKADALGEGLASPHLTSAAVSGTPPESCNPECSARASASRQTHALQTCASRPSQGLLKIN